MRKLIYFAALCAAACTLAFSGCGKGLDLTDYVSERRTEIYLYCDDDAEIKIYCGAKEQPYAADGYVGKIGEIVEIFVKLSKPCDKVEVDLYGDGGEMNYLAAKGVYYLCFTKSANFGESAEVTLNLSGTAKTYAAASAKYAGVISWQTALKCASEYAAELFSSLTDGKLFNGEIAVRLICDEGKCFYYVAVCDKTNSVYAFLVNGESGKIIAEKKTGI